MNQFEIVTTIDRPVTEVWAFLEDFSRMPAWNAGLTKAYTTSEGPVGVGTNVVFQRKFLARPFEVTQEHTADVPHQRLVAKTAAGPLHIALESTLEPTQAG